METVLVTGAGGYIGSNAAEYFVRAGFRVIGSVRERIAERLKSSGAEIVKADLTDPDAASFLCSRRPDYIVHVAARASDIGRDEWFREANYEAVKRLASAAMRSGVRRFVYLSTSDVYGLRDFHGETEDELRRDDAATNPYPKYKILSERWLEENVPPERRAFVRPCVVFGRGDTSITPRTVAYLRSSPVAFHFGRWKGRNRWPLAHVENVSLALHAAMVLPEAGGRAVTVLDSKRTTVSGYYHALAAEFLPGRRIREATLPMALIRPVARLFSTLSRNRDRPLFDPTLYALDTISHNLDFSNARLLRWFKALGTSEFIADSFA